MEKDPITKRFTGESLLRVKAKHGKKVTLGARKTKRKPRLTITNTFHLHSEPFLLPAPSPSQFSILCTSLFSSKFFFTLAPRGPLSSQLL
jgi:hypothetical protein